MSTNTERDTHRAALQSWNKRRRALDAERDPLVLEALNAGINIEDIHKMTDLGRTTIMRIRDAAKEEQR